MNDLITKEGSEKNRTEEGKERGEGKTEGRKKKEEEWSFKDGYFENSVVF